jgi:hypothetical protein
MTVRMLRFPLVGALLIATSSLSSTQAADAVAADSITNNISQEDQCGLYLAVSSTSTDDNAFWGVYAGKDYKEGETVGVPELAINTHNLRYNVISSKSGPPPASVVKSLGFLEEYVNLNVYSNRSLNLELTTLLFTL